MFNPDFVRISYLSFLGNCSVFVRYKVRESTLSIEATNLHTVCDWLNIGYCRSKNIVNFNTSYLESML